MHKSYKLFVVAAFCALALAACDKAVQPVTPQPEPEPEPKPQEEITYTFTCGQLAEYKADFMITASAAVTEDAVFKIDLDPESTIKSAAVTFPSEVMIYKDKTEAKGTLSVTAEELEPGVEVKIILNASKGETKIGSIMLTVVGPEPVVPKPGEFVIDADPKDWEGLENVVTLECPEGAEMTGLEKAMIYYGDKLYFFLYISDEAVADGKVRLHVFFSTDKTGKLAHHWENPDIDYMTEGKITNGGQFVSYSSSFYVWDGTVEEPWKWADSGAAPTCEGAGSGKCYEMSMDYSTFPGGLPDAFYMGLDVVNSNWAAFGFLPQTPTKAIVKKPGAADPELESPTGIAIDGKFEDWANITNEISDPEGVYMDFKIAYDSENIFCYVKRDNNEAMWANGGYIYFDFDLDNDPSTGVEHDSVPGLDYYMYTYMYGGTAAEPAINSCPKTKVNGNTVELADGCCAGVITDTAVETEIVFPRSIVGVEKGQTIRVYTWGNKSASNIKTQYLVLNIEK